MASTMTILYEYLCFYIQNKTRSGLQLTSDRAVDWSTLTTTVAIAIAANDNCLVVNPSSKIILNPPLLCKWFILDTPYTAFTDRSY